MLLHAMPHQAAARGLREELGMEVEEQRLAGPLVEPHLRQLHVPEAGVLDCEFVTSFRWDPVLASYIAAAHQQPNQSWSERVNVSAP